jgi:hypothetical protein
VVTKKMRIKTTIIFIWMAALACGQPALPLLKISGNKRYFETADGKPFFWLGDTGWLLFKKTTREEAAQYLDIRKQQGFNVVQVMVLHELETDKNAYGDAAVNNMDVSKPATTPGNDYKNQQEYDYWDHVDYIIDEAGKRGIYMALVPVWGSNVKGGHINTQQAEAYAAFLANRFKEKNNIIWLNGGDLNGSIKTEVWNTIGITIKKYDAHHLMSYHPRGRNSSSQWFHNESWLDFNMIQSGHKTYAQDTNSNETLHYGEDNWRYINTDYNLTPVKPTLDGEPSYENIPHGLHDSMQPRWTAADIRRYAYWSVFAGGAGFTYGENAVMQFHTPGDVDANYGVNQNWREAIHSKGATQMQYLRKLTEEKNDLERSPAQELLVDNTGEKYEHIVAMKGKNYVMAYTWAGKNIKIDCTKAGFAITQARWYNPTDGTTMKIDAGGGEWKGIAEFAPPGMSLNKNDWVLILE